MNVRTKDIGLGIGTIVLGLFLVLYAIPTFITSPSNIQTLVLSPTFWPMIVAWIIVLLGAILIATRIVGPASTQTSAPDDPFADHGMEPSEGLASWLRIAAIAIVMGALVYAIPIVGMVWASMLAFVALAFIIQTDKPVTAVIVAIAMPLLLYAFFAHIAGVAVPQGEFVTLP